MKKLIDFLYKFWREHRLVSKRIYTYGQAGLWLNDDRSILEKLCDNIDTILSNLKERYRFKEKYVFHSFFDTSTWQWITSTSQIRQIEKTGKIFATPREFEQEAAKNKKWNKAQFNKKVREGIEADIRKVKQGYSVKKELHSKYQPY